MEHICKVNVKASKDYDILIGDGLLDAVGGQVRRVLGPCRPAVLTDDTVDALYGGRVLRSLAAAGLDACKFVFPHGESSKNLGVMASFLDFMAEHRLTRGDAVIALGGGVPGDMGGFAAAVFLRGVPCVQIPTTLLAAVDSSVGGKTAVDIPAGKNLAGAFHQPSLVLCDTKTLDTLPPDILRDGFAEVVKYGVILDEDLFSAVSVPPVQDMQAVIRRCVELKRDVVGADEFDRGTRQLLNFGHTVGHAIEQLSGFTVSHGSAVAKGMLRAARMGAAMGLGDFTAPIRDTLLRYGFDLSCPYTPEELFDVMLNDKKRLPDTITLVLPERIGRCGLYKMPVSRALELLKATAS